MGVPLRLPLKRPPRTSAPRPPPLVQPAPTTQLDRRPTTDQPRLTGLWVPQLARAAAPHGRSLLPERRVRERLQRLVQSRELTRDAQQVLARVEMAVERVHLGAETVEPLEQGVHLPVGDFFPFHLGQFRASSSAR